MSTYKSGGFFSGKQSGSRTGFQGIIYRLTDKACVPTHFGRDQKLPQDLSKLNNEISQMKTDLETANENFFRCDNEVKVMRAERDRLKQRIVKLKSRKGRVDLGIKICKKCGKDYNEVDNMNWSCRMHMSQYSGEMWWCCRKKGLDAPGCQFSRHEERK